MDLCRTPHAGWMIHGTRPRVIGQTNTTCTTARARGKMTSTGSSWSPDEVDLTRPSMARVYDFHLGGSQNVESGRASGRHALEAFPGLSAVLCDPSATAGAGDICEPRRVLGAAEANGLLDLGRPAAALLVAAPHVVPDVARPAEIVEQYMDATVPGSFLALSHARRDGATELLDAAEVYDGERSPGRVRWRSRSEIEALFGGLAFVAPGVEVLPGWRPELTDDREPPEADESHPGLAGVGRRD